VVWILFPNGEWQTAVCPQRGRAARQSDAGAAAAAGNEIWEDGLKQEASMISSIGVMKAGIALPALAAGAPRRESERRNHGTSERCITGPSRGHLS